MKKDRSYALPLLFLGIFTLGFSLPGFPLFAGGTAEGEDTQSKNNSSSILAYVSILPQRYFVEQIAGPSTEVRVMVPPGKSPATYEPSPKQVTTLGGADVFFTIGVPFEKAFIPVIRDELKNLAIIDTSRGIEKRSIHGDHGHEKELPDPHIWLSPPLVKKQAVHIRDALLHINPEKEQLYRKNYQQFAEELEQLDADLRRILEPVKGSTILVYHPSFGYFAETYGLSQIAIEMGGKEPSSRELQRVIRTAQEKNARVIFVQPEFSKASARKVAQAINGVVVEVAPLKPEYMHNMRSIARSIRDGLAEKK